MQGIESGPAWGIPASERRDPVIGLLISILLAALVYWLCVAIGLPAIVGIVAAIIVLIGGVGTGGLGARSWR
jgi:hypothetical protein